MYILIILILKLSIQSLDPIFTKDFTIHQEISEDLKRDIVNSTMTVIDEYINYGDFWNKTSQAFSNEDYGAFVSLFAGDATIVDDVRWNDYDLHYAEYARLIYDKMQDTGLQFQLKDIKIKKIDIDDTGFYVVDLEMTKRLYTGLTRNFSTVQLRSGRTTRLEMRIDLPDYLLSDARIQYIRLKKSSSLLTIAKMPFEFIGKKFSKEKR